jgi:hypothetical protein
MRYYQITLETPGEWAKDAVIDTAVSPPIISRASINLMTDRLCDLMEVHPMTIVSDALAARLTSEKLTGLELRDIYLSRKSRQKDGFKLLIINGKHLKDDIFIGNNNMTIISQRFIDVIRLFELGSHEVNDYAPMRTAKEELHIQMQQMKERIASKYPKEK